MGDSPLTSRNFIAALRARIVFYIFIYSAKFVSDVAFGAISVIPF
jgi:hypothetical protein